MGIFIGRKTRAGFCPPRAAAADKRAEGRELGPLTSCRKGAFVSRLRLYETLRGKERIFRAPPRAGTRWETLLGAGCAVRVLAAVEGRCVKSWGRMFIFIVLSLHFNL